MEIIGQKNLKTKLDSYSITEFPKTILFIGEQGCGKKLLAKHTADRLGLEFVELEEKVTNEDLEIFESNTYPTMYFINLDLFSDKQQNSFLKFIEEPVANVYVVLGCESETTVLPTILSRSAVLSLNLKDTQKKNQLLFAAMSLYDKMLCFMRFFIHQEK